MKKESNTMSQKVNSQSFLFGVMSVLTLISIVAFIFLAVKFSGYKNIVSQLQTANAELTLRQNNLEDIYTGGLEEYVQQVNQAATKKFKQMLSEQ